jgi:hypothetical protein
MKLEPHHIAEKKTAGRNTQNGTPVMYVATHGGLHCYFANLQGHIRCVGAAPHPAIAKFLVDQRFPGVVEWAKESK